MQTASNKRLSLRLRLFLSIILAIIIIIMDHNYTSFSKIRIYMDTVLSPLYFFVNSPQKLLDLISVTFSSHQKLCLEIKQLHNQLILKNSELLLLDHVKKENIYLRELLGANILQNDHKILTQVISNVSEPYSDQVVIDKGSINHIYQGQPVISERGVIGQVITVSKTTSRVLLLCDVSHALPVQILRNGIRAIAIGHGCTEELQLEYISDYTDIRKGDFLITSGLGGRFPEGYPVAIISSVTKEIKNSNIIIRARPIANLQYLRYLILLERGVQNSVSLEK
ncbi:rod shape-determining protein MreC [Candidatus Erwinia haradaeae]|uniref:Cell shape-determining protein MreC n=1 Tax=Candidatus Erwinia haradaeae TaxID=1922217 RepID=A0A451D2C7_9GAMM|nr:rod shape-determining protein MreC [Candidatus Erwinia haradaeae]VFP79782.1 Cell shape-determining protein MreC [Candidatus Erwinia haradaeae]